MVIVTPPGRLGPGWSDRVAAAPVRTLADLCASEPTRDVLVVLSAHPDDETIGAGRLLSAWARSRGAVSSVLATAGEACVDHVGRRPSGLAGRRLAEWRGAMQVLGVDPAVVLGLPDGGLTEVEDTLAAGLADHLTQLSDGPRRTVLLAPHTADPHPDHEAAGRAAVRAGRDLDVPVWHFPVWLTHWADPSTPLGGELVTLWTGDADTSARARALEWFVSQTAPLAPGWGPVVPATMLARHTDQVLVLPAGSSC